MADQMKIFPQSTLGKLSVGLAEDMVQRPLLAWTMLIAMSSGVLALVTGVLAIRLKKDQTTLVWIATGLGALLLVFLIGELVFPH